jgi:serine/threonine-protein kinase
MDSSAVDGRADVYALGATLYFLLAGHPMFPTGSTAQKLMWQQWKDPTPIRQLRPEVPAPLERVIQKALAKKPADRFQTPLDFAEALAPFAVGLAAPPQHLIPSPPPRKGRPEGASRPSLHLPPYTPSGSTPLMTPPQPRPGVNEPVEAPTPLPRALARPAGPIEEPQPQAAGPPIVLIAVIALAAVALLAAASLALWFLI